ncbi:conserved hypothetical protein, putative ATPase (plasmid) [Clavibacter michiganensis subsp. michiganensis NCPPB 382]|uniref:Uncharacterized protein n=1 Tax=Clavibacter michiganensis subsp. michiganensis (strain NCPPB 382) TaxID=443906 RepID=A5CLN0_CLAM3|nr:conserved hypothetical protein, putative ATPase [Clavibacter michiganensis subsp. michiganensis NCPPB 382]
MQGHRDRPAHGSVELPRRIRRRLLIAYRTPYVTHVLTGDVRRCRRRVEGAGVLGEVRVKRPLPRPGVDVGAAKRGRGRERLRAVSGLIRARRRRGSRGIGHRSGRGGGLRRRHAARCEHQAHDHREHDEHAEGRQGGLPGHERALPVSVDDGGRDAHPRQARCRRHPLRHDLHSPGRGPVARDLDELRRRLLEEPRDGRAVHLVGHVRHVGDDDDRRLGEARIPVLAQPADGPGSPIGRRDRPVRHDHDVGDAAEDPGHRRVGDARAAVGEHHAVVARHERLNPGVVLGVERVGHLGVLLPRDDMQPVRVVHVPPELGERSDRLCLPDDVGHGRGRRHVVGRLPDHALGEIPGVRVHVHRARRVAAVLGKHHPDATGRRRLPDAALQGEDRRGVAAGQLPADPRRKLIGLPLERGLAEVHHSPGRGVHGCAQPGPRPRFRRLHEAHIRPTWQRIDSHRCGSRRRPRHSGGRHRRRRRALGRRR